MKFFRLLKKQPSYTLAGFDLTTHIFTSGGDTTRTRRQGTQK
jgi:hypothetical protein